MPRMVRAVRESIEIIQGAATAQPFEYQGEIFQINGYCAAWAKATAPLVYAAASKPQMLRMAGRVADGVMLSDVTLPRIEESIDALGTGLHERSRATENFPISNLYAWHVKPDKAAAMREARAKLFVRGMLEPWYIDPFLTPEESSFVDANLGAFAQAYIRNTDHIEGVPDPLIDQLVDNLTFTGGLDSVDRFTSELVEFKNAGVTEFAIRLYADPEDSMQLIAERVMPAVALT